MTKLARAARHTDLVRLMLPPEDQKEAETEAQVAEFQRGMEESVANVLTNGTRVPYDDAAIGPVRDAMRRSIAESQAAATPPGWATSDRTTQNYREAARWWANPTLGRQVPRDRDHTSEEIARIRYGIANFPERAFASSGDRRNYWNEMRASAIRAGVPCPAQMPPHAQTWRTPQLQGLRERARPPSFSVPVGNSTWGEGPLRYIRASMPPDAPSSTPAHALANSASAPPAEEPQVASDQVDALTYSLREIELRRSVGARGDTWASLMIGLGRPRRP